MVSFLLLIEARNFCVFRKMEESEFRAVIEHLYLQGLRPKEIKTELDEVHGISTPVFATVYVWLNEFMQRKHVFRVIPRVFGITLANREIFVVGTFTLLGR